MKAETNTLATLESESWRQLSDCSKEQLEELLSFLDENDSARELKERVALIISTLRRKEARERACSILIEKEHSWLEAVLANSDLLPNDRQAQLAYLILSCQWQKYLHLFRTDKHRELAQKLKDDDSVSRRMLEKICNSNDLNCVRIVLELFCMKSLRPELERTLHLALAEKASEEARLEVCKFWLDSRDERLAKIIKYFEWLPQKPPRLRVLAALKTGFSAYAEKIAGKNGFGNAGGIFSAESIEYLIEATGDQDPQLSKSAKETIVSLKDQDLQEAVLARLLGKSSAKAHEIDALQELAPAFEYEPSDHADRVLFALLLHDFDRFVLLDPESKTLQSIYTKADHELKERIACCLQAAKHHEWMLTVCGPHESLKLSEMTELDWQLLQKTLSASSAWDKLFRILPLLPASSALSFLKRLALVQWAPENHEDRERFERLLSFSKRLKSAHPAIWSDIELWKVLDLEKEYAGRLEGGAGSWDSRFGFSFDGGEFYELESQSRIRSFSLPSCHPGSLKLNISSNLTAIALSPRQSLMALGDENGRIWLYDTKARKIENRLETGLIESGSFESKLFEAKLFEANFFEQFGGGQSAASSPSGPTAITYLNFSASASYLLALQKSNLKPELAESVAFQTNNWQRTAFAIPPYASVSENNSWLLYRELNSLILEKLNYKREKKGSIAISFRDSQMDFLPDSSAVFLNDGLSINVYRTPDLLIRERKNLSNFGCLCLSEQQRSKLLVLASDYSFCFFNTDKDSVDKAEIFQQASSQTESQRLRLTEAGVTLALANDYHAAMEPYSVFRILKDPEGQYLAIVHASGKLSLWVSSLFKYAQKSAALMDSQDFAHLRSRLNSSNSSEDELNWIRFILELSGSYEHYAIEISDSGCLEFSCFDIELA